MRIFNKVKCEVIAVKTDTSICQGPAGTKLGEIFTIGARTPETRGMCVLALSAIAPMKMAMTFTEKTDWEKEDYLDIVCPHGVVTYRLSRMKEK